MAVNKQKKDHPFKNHKMPFPMMVFFSVVTFVFKILDIVSPKLAGRLALYFFMKPPQFGAPRREKKFRDEASLSFITVRDRKISLRHWGDKSKPKVLLSHGWGGRCTQLHAFIQPLVDAGYCVLGFDIPGHGDSEGKASNMMDAASIIKEIESQEGSFDAIIGHSFGSATTLLSINKFGVKVNKIILISCFADIELVTTLFGSLFALKKTTIEAMKTYALKKYANNYNINWSWDGISPKNTIKTISAEILLIHDKKDHEVPFEQAEVLQAAAPQAQLMTTTGLGHRKILMNAKVVKTTLEFILRR